MKLAIAPSSMAAKIPITPLDEIWVRRVGDTLRCYINFAASSTQEAARAPGHFAGCARAAPGSRLPAAKWFKATALSSGDGHSVPMVAVKRVCTVCGKGPLPAIGWARANGADHRDWSFRQTHKKCWKPK